MNTGHRRRGRRRAGRFRRHRRRLGVQREPRRGLAGQPVQLLRQLTPSIRRPSRRGRSACRMGRPSVHAIDHPGVQRGTPAARRRCARCGPTCWPPTDGPRAGRRHRRRQRQHRPRPPRWRAASTRRRCRSASSTAPRAAREPPSAPASPRATRDSVGFMDADGATDLDALAGRPSARSRPAPTSRSASRALDDSVTFERHSRLREVGAGVYRRLTRTVAPGVVDTQCGFKVMRGDLAREVFASTRCDGFSFDVEVIGRFQRRGRAGRGVPGRLGRRARARPSCPPVTASPPSARWPTIAWRLRSELEPDVRPTVPRASRCRDQRRSTCSGRRRLAGLPPTLRGRRVAVVNWRDPWHSLAGGSERYAWEFALALLEAGARRRLRHRPRPAPDARASRATGSASGAAATVHVLPVGVVAAAASPPAGRATTWCIDAENGIPVVLAAARRRVVRRSCWSIHHVHQDQFRTYFPPPLAAAGPVPRGAG